MEPLQTGNFSQSCTVFSQDVPFSLKMNAFSLAKTATILAVFWSELER